MSFYPPVGTGDFIGVSQTQVVEGNTPQDATHWQFQPAGTTGTLGPYSTIFSVQTYGTSPAVTETVWILGYNTPSQYGGPDYDTANGSVYMYIHPDAGDTNVGGAHGLEWGVSVAGPDQDWIVNAIQVIAVNDANESVAMVLRYSTGTDSTDNNFQVINATTGNIVWKCSYSGAVSDDEVSSQAPYWLIEPASGSGTNLIFDLASPDQGVVVTLQAANGKNAQIAFSDAGTTKWLMNGVGTSNYFSLEDSSSANYPIYIQPVASDVPLFRSQSTFRVETGSVIIGNAAIATTATRGFLYIPSCAGAPTGTPVSQTGTIPMVYDTTDARLYLYESGGWHYISMTA